jgi:hypothetical protein
MRLVVTGMFGLSKGVRVHKAPTKGDLNSGSVAITVLSAQAGISIGGLRRGRSLLDGYLEPTQ